MDAEKVVKVLEATMKPDLRQEAEAQLKQMYKIAGFTPLLLQIVMSDEMVMAVRQSGAIYLKNMCQKHWNEKTDADGAPINDIFSIHENDKNLIRNNVVEAVAVAPDIIRNQLTVVVNNVIKHDYPEKWPAVIEKIKLHLQADQPRAWMGALLTLYQLVKNYEFKKPEDRGPLVEAMKIFIPVMLQLFKRFIEDNTATSVLLQKQLLKILYALIQYSLPLELFSENILDEWVNLIQIVIGRPVPDETLQVDELERPELPWWKCKKWAIHFIARMFERYGSPGSVTKEYTDFAEFFLKRYSLGVMSVILKVLDEYRNKVYVSPRVLQQALHFLDQSISHAHTWKALKGGYLDILRDIIFPLMCFTDEDQEVWEDDPHEYIRVKFDVFEDFLSPSSAAQCFLHSACSKRKQVLQRTMQLCNTVLNEAANSNTEEAARKKDGALHMIGSLGDTLMKKKMFKDQLEPMIKAHILPELNSQYGYMRARSCWVIQHFSEAKFRNREIIVMTAEGLKQLLIHDKELPVRVEAAMAIQNFIGNQPAAEKHCSNDVKAIINALLHLVHETENDDLTNVVQKVICLFCEQVIPIAVEITKNLTMTFLKILETTNPSNGEGGDGLGALDDDDNSDDKAVTAMGILSTIETVLEMMEEEREITIQLEAIIAPLVAHVLKHRIMDFYEEIFSLMYSLTCQAISPPMWEALPLIYEVFQDDGFDYFTEMMPCLHSFCTIGQKELMANPKYLEVIYAMCKKVLETEVGEDPECHAAKLLEVIILQCKGQIDQVIPLFVEVALMRLTREVKTSELRTMCLQVVIAALYYNPVLLLTTLENIRFPNTAESVTEQFFKQWFSDVDCFLGIHDRKMCILGFCVLLNLPSRPAIVDQYAGQILPLLVMLFDGLVRAYKANAEEEGESSSDDSDESDDDDGIDDRVELASDEDEIDEDSAEYLEMLQKKAIECDDDFESIDDGETLMEAFPTLLEDESCTIDEFVVFKQVFSVIKDSHSAWFGTLTQALNEQQQKSLNDIFVLADQRHAAAESKKIEKTGGYKFGVTNVPTTFNFASERPQTLSP